MRIHKTVLAATAIAGISAVTSANAFLGDWDMLSTTVPASICSPVDSANAAKVRLSNGAWVFQGGATGSVQFYCPLTVNGYSLSDSLLAAIENADVEGGTPAPPSIQIGNSVSFYRIYYRDPDGGLESEGGGGGGFRGPGDLGSGERTALDSNVVAFGGIDDIVDEGGGDAEPGQATWIKTMLMYRDKHGKVAVEDSFWNSDWTPDFENTNTTAEHGLSSPHALEIDALYAFEVEMYRADSSLDPAFSGIDFILQDAP